MNGLVEKLYSEADFHTRNLTRTYFPSLIAGMSFRAMAIAVCDYFGVSSGLPRNGIPLDELLRPAAVYATIAIAEKVLPTVAGMMHRKFPSYAPKAAAWIAWSVFWEGAEYLTPLAEALKHIIHIHPVPWGTAHDGMMTTLMVYLYGNGLERRGPGQQQRFLSPERQ